MRKVEFHPGYTIDESGKVFSHVSNKYLSTWISHGYENVSIGTGGNLKIKIHRELAKAFIPNPDNLPVVNHINGIRNDNRLENLEWTTYSGNLQHAHDNLERKSIPTGDDHAETEIPDEVCYRIYEMKEQGFTARKIAEELGLLDKLTNVQCIATGKYQRNATLKKWLKLTGREEYKPISNQFQLRTGIRDKNKERFEIIKQKLIDGYTNRELADEYGVAIQTARKWRRKFMK